jgi:hypothetical protein
MSNILIILCLVVVGIAAFFFGVLYVVCQGLASGGKRLLGPLARRGQRGRGAPPALPIGRRGRQVCSNQRCEHVEHRPARYCSQCGKALSRSLRKGRV